MKAVSKNGSVEKEQYISRDEVSRAVLKDPAKVLRALVGIKKKLDDLQKPIIEEIQQLLLSVEGLDLGSFDANKEFATEAQEILDRLNVRSKCSHEKCSALARLECTHAGRTRHGSFRMVHRVGERHQAHHSCTVIPRLSLKKL